MGAELKRIKNLWAYPVEGECAVASQRLDYAGP